MIDILFPKIHQEGYRFLIISIIILLISLFFSKLLTILTFVMTIWVYYFFRDPDRVVINDENYLVSPADGTIVQIAETNGPKELSLDNKQFTKISIFMNVFDCHVNRIPTSGKISEIFYVPGKFFNASLDKSSQENERNLIKIKKEDGKEIILVQIAGLIAKRIVCECKKNQDLKQGDKLGIIRFGSRVDIYFSDYKLLVKEKQKTIAGETLIAKLT